MTSGAVARAYPRLSRRIYAAVIDAAIILACLVAVILVIGPLEPEPWVFIGLIAALVLVEPVLVSTTFGSIGHHVLGIKIINRRTGRRIGILAAIARMIARVVLGLLSLLFMSTTKEYRALHDMLSGSLVVLRDPASMPASAILVERQLEDSGFVYPPLWQRGLFIFLYAVLAYFILAISTVVFLSNACIFDNQCSDRDHAASVILGFIFLITLSILMVQGVKGKLPGARRSRNPEAPTD